MKFLIDNALSPYVAEALKTEGYAAVHIRDYGMQDADDEDIFEFAAEEDMVIISLIPILVHLEQAFLDIVQKRNRKKAGKTSFFACR